jgi:tight adherence protein B
MSKLLELAALAEAGISLREAQKLVQVENLMHHTTLQVAEAFGGPVAKTLKRQAEVVAQVAAANRSLEVAFATPKATAKLMLWLPPGGFLFGQLIGLNPVPVILHNFVAQMSLIIGLALQIIGVLWSGRILRRGRPVLSDSGLIFDLVAIGLRAGISPLLVRRRLIQLIEISEADAAQLDRLESLSRHTGAPLENLLLAQAETARLDAAALAEAQVAAIAIKLMIPLGVVILPAFVLMSVVPIVISILV